MAYNPPSSLSLKNVMSVETLQRLHSRYADLSSRFRAGWAFHQYAEGMRKIHPGDPQRPVVTEGFQAVYATLKAISSKLNAEDAGAIEGELDSVGERLRRLTAALAEEDNRVPPEVVRQFFRRVKNEDENVLTQIVKCYLYMGTTGSGNGAGGWTVDRLDKLDFLVTRLAEERDASSDRFVLADSRRLFDLANGFWAIAREGAEEEGPGEGEVEGITKRLRALRRDVASAASLEQLHDGSMVGDFRALKHGLGANVFHPRLLAEILETNLVFKNLVRELYSVEERRIAADYQRVFDLEREVAVDGELDADLRSFRAEVEGFERRLQRDELKLRELAHLRERIRNLSDRLTATASAEATRPGVEPAEGDGGAAADGVGGEADLLAEAVARLDAALEDVPPDVPARRAVLGSALYGMRLESRELEAHRRLRDASGAFDREVERTVVEAAALRVLINEQVEELRALLDETSTTGEAPVFQRSRRTLRLASAHAARLGAAAEQALVRGGMEEAQELTVLKMRMVREHAGAWLLAMRPLLARQGRE
jgi:hypothetical protein